MTRRCYICKTEKSALAFGRDRKRVDGLQLACRQCVNERNREIAREQREALINDLGGGCKCCGETTYELLQVDHINGTGHVYRGPRNGSGIKPYVLRQHIDELQVLCGSCHHAKSAYGACPHASFRLVDML